ncbi:hypothetical protein ACLKA7_017209 [Drosophila subpalustris]
MAIAYEDLLHPLLQLQLQLLVGQDSECLVSSSDAASLIFAQSISSRMQSALKSLKSSRSRSRKLHLKLQT